jgi:hypothetical protein
MPPNMNNQGPQLPKQPPNIGRLTTQLFGYAWALARLAAGLVVVATVCGALYVAIRAVAFAAHTVIRALGI